MGPEEQPAVAADHRFEVPEGIRRARAAFLGDFPRLIADRRFRGKYVCYHNDSLVAVHKDYFALIREVVARNIPDNSFLIFEVVPGEDHEQQLIADEAEIDPDYQ